MKMFFTIAVVVLVVGLLLAFIALSAIIALLQYNWSLTFIAQLMSISWGALAGAFLGPFLWGLYSGKVSKVAVWCSFIFGVGMTTGNMALSLLGTPLIASPINCGAFVMIASLIIVPVVSLFTKSIPFEVNPPTPEGAIDREIAREMEKHEALRAADSANAENTEGTEAAAVVSAAVDAELAEPAQA